MSDTEKFVGKYRGIVVNNIDPNQTGRLTVQVPDVANVLPSTWAMPCAPFAGAGCGSFQIPPVGSGVWVEFEQGNPDYPIWSGCYWGSAAEVPPLASAGPPGVQQIVIQSVGMNTLLLSDTPGPTGGILLQSSSGAMIAINDTGITISNGNGATITLIGPSVTINDGALLVTYPRRIPCHGRFPTHSRRNGNVLARRPGNADGAQSQRIGKRSADSHDFGTVGHRGLPAGASGAGTMRHGRVGPRNNESHLQRYAPGRPKRRGHLRPERHAAHTGALADTRRRNLSES